jgi:bisanhydrobacterioruberin hydratase
MRHGIQHRLPSLLFAPQAMGWSVFLALLVHIAGALGMWVGDRAFFVSFTSWNLLLMFVLVCWNDSSDRQSFLWTVAVLILLGWASEIIGVNTGWLFGDYQYGSVLGEGVWGVPLIIGINWFTVVYASHMLVRFLTSLYSELTPYALYLSAGVATAFDWIMEPVAITLDFWSWNAQGIPLYNYITWFLVSLLANVFLGKMKGIRYNSFAAFLLVVQAFFFLALRLFL